LIKKFAADQPAKKAENRPIREVPMHWLGILHQRKAQEAEGNSDPWRRALERDLPANVTYISTVAILDLLGLAPTTGNARRIAPTMRSMGFIPLKSRRLMPGGNRGTTIRGWARPFLELKKSTSIMNETPAQPVPANKGAHRYRESTVGERGVGAVVVDPSARRAPFPSRVGISLSGVGGAADGALQCL
jgi:hypothetical protein